MTDDQWTRSFSWSKMSTYKRCPRQFKFKYVDKIDTEMPSEARDDGINFHNYMEQYYTRMTAPEEGPRVEHAVAVAKDMWPEHLQAKYRQWVEQWHAWNEHIYGVWGEEHWTPLFVEYWTEVEIQDSHNTDALLPGETHHGYVDRIQWDPQSKSYGVIDYKSKAKDGSSIKGQTAYYGDMLLELEGVLDAPIEWAGCYGYKTGKFKKWDIHWASIKATKKKVVELRELKNDYEPNFGYHCEWCDFVEECNELEAENEGLLGL